MSASHCKSVPSDSLQYTAHNTNDTTLLTKAPIGIKSMPVARSAAMRANKAKVPHCIKRASFSLLRFIPEKNT